MWKSAILADEPTVAQIRFAQPELVAKIDAMLFQTDDPSSCFYDEVTTQGRAPSLADMLNSDSAIFIVGMRGKPLGCVAVDTHADPPYVRSLCIDHSERGHGVGSVVLKHLQRLFPTLHLTVFRANPRVMRFYAQHGFKVGEFKAPYLHMYYDRA